MRTIVRTHGVTHAFAGRAHAEPHRPTPAFVAAGGLLVTTAAGRSAQHAADAPRHAGACARAHAHPPRARARVQAELTLSRVDALRAYVSSGALLMATASATNTSLQVGCGCGMGVVIKGLGQACGGACRSPAVAPVLGASGVAGLVGGEEGGTGMVQGWG
jgi:hypothetical protein